MQQPQQPPQQQQQPQQPQQQPQQQQQVADDDDDQLNTNNLPLDGPDEVFISDSEEMVEDKSVIPSSFSGKASDDGDVWLRHFRNYCAYKKYGDQKSLALLKVLLTGMQHCG